MASDLIRRDTLLENAYMTTPATMVNPYGGDYVVSVEDIENAPTVDAVEVVRCKGCKHWLHVEEGFGDCTNPRFHLPGHADPTMNADDFCSCGERRTKG